MKEILILFIIFGILFIIEKKSINLLAYYVGMVIIIAFIISNYELLYNNLGFNTIKIGGDIGYISYILVLVQISALTILFGFIIMLFPKNNTDVLINKKEIYVNINKTINNIFEINKGIIKNMKIVLILSILFIMTIIYYILIINNISDITNLKNILNTIYISILPNIIPIENLAYNNILNTWENSIDLNNNTIELIKKISYLIYSDPSNIIKFMVITLILLFAIIGLFFILLPTYIY